MAHWSTYGEFDINNELGPCCCKGHRPSFLLQTESGTRICLLCLSGLISDSTAFLTHRTYAIDEFLLAMKDNEFFSDLMTYHNHLLVAPLCEAISSSKDAVFSKSVMDSILAMCDADEIHSNNLVEDFIIHIARKISALSQSNRTQWQTVSSLLYTRHYLKELSQTIFVRPSMRINQKFSSKTCTKFPSTNSHSGKPQLHVMGLLLELYCKQNNYLPDAIRTQRGFLPNLISFLRNPGTEFQGEVLFVLYKLASLEDGTEDLLRCCPKLCTEAIHALLRSDSDELRINCLALLTILAERSVLKIEFSSYLEDEKWQLSMINGSKDKQMLSFSKIFIQAVKGCLLSSDFQVQASALRLINLVYSDKARLQDGLQIIVEEGIVNYVVEILRISGEQETVQSLALDVLTLLSNERHTYMHRFPLVIQTLIPILEKVIDSPSVKLQKDILDLICIGVFEQPGILLTSHCDKLLAILSRLFDEYQAIMDENVWDGWTVQLPPTFFPACSTLIALTQAPSCSLTCSASEVFQKATKCAIEFSSSYVKMNPDFSCLKISFCLLQAAYEYNRGQIHQNELFLITQESLIHLCHGYLLPAFVENVEKVEDVNLVSTVLKTFTFILNNSHPEKAAEFAERLALQKCFTLSFDLLARFSSSSMKEEIYQFISSLIERLVQESFEPDIVKAFLYLPANPTSLLLLLEQNSKGEEKLLAAQHAVISILSTSSLYNDRLATDIDIIASLEQHLLLNKDSTLSGTIASDETLKHFLSLYVTGRRVLQDCNISSSLEAEKVLEEILFQSKGRILLCSETPKDILRWFLEKDSLKDFTIVQLLTWFTTVENMYLENHMQVMASPLKISGGTGGYEHLHTLAELIVEEPCFTNVLLSLFYWLGDQGNYDGIGTVLRTITVLARMGPNVGLQLISCNFERSLLPLIHPEQVKVSKETGKFCLELLFQMLFNYHNNLAAGITCNRYWVDVANQCVYLILFKANIAFDEELVPHLSLVNMILFKSNEEASLMDASNVIACNRDLCTRLEDHIIIAASKGEKLSETNFATTEGQVLCAAMIFHLLRIRWALKHKTCNNAASYVGFEASEWSQVDVCSQNYATTVTCKELCRILYNGSTTLKILASFCIEEIFSQLHIPHGSESLDTVKILDLPSRFFMSMTMTLQGSILEDLAVVRRNASSSLFLLLHSPSLSPEQRKIVANNPWNRMLVEHLLASLSTTHREGAACTCGPSLCYAAQIGLGILKITPSLEWLPIVFSKSIISDVVANLSEDKISPNIICIFQELLRLKYLTNDHLIRLRNLFQAARKMVYDFGSVLHEPETPETLRKRNASYLTECINHLQIHDVLQSSLLELVVQSSLKPGMCLCLENDFMNILSNDGGFACISIIDKFIQDSNLFSE